MNKKMLFFSIILSAFLVACGDKDEVTNAPDNAPVEKPNTVDDNNNNDVNRIKRDIQESPYKIRNLGIQVMVDSPEGESGINDAVRSDIEQILSTIVRTSIDQDVAGNLTDDEIANRIVVSVQKFQGNDTDATDTESVIPWWVWVQDL